MNVIIQKWGNSQGIRIPKLLLEDLGIKENDSVNLIVENGKIIIEKIEKQKNINELFENYSGDYNLEKIDWGNPVGKEIW